MLLNIRPKHQKLILQCYPSPKLSIAETRPNQAELSYLVYYASSRRTKLEKVGAFLIKKTSSDISHKRVGHLKVTLYILQELIISCSEDLGILTPYVLKIIHEIINLSELSTCQLSSEVFIKYCEILQPIQKQIFSSNLPQLNLFLEILNKFLTFSSVQNSKDWLIISLKTTLCIAEYIDTTYGQFIKINLVGKSITLLLQTFSSESTDLSLVKLKSSSSVSNTSDNSNDPTPEINAKLNSIDELTVTSLKSFFDTSNKRQLDLSIIAILDYVLKENKMLRWTNRLIIICAKKTHIEMRYRIISILIKEIEKFNKNDVKAYLSTLIANLLNSDDVNLIGLPVKDILSKLLEFEKHMIINNQVKQLQEPYSDIIRSLCRKVYYNNQINDMINEILSVYYYESSNNNNNNSDSNNSSNHNSDNDRYFLEYSNTLISNIYEILNISRESIVKLKKSSYPINLFNYLYYSLNFEKFPAIREDVQIQWFKLLQYFYTITDEDYSIPNKESCIINNTDNSLCLLFDVIEKILFENSDKEIQLQITETVLILTKKFKINFLINFLKFSKKWLSSINDFKYFLSIIILSNLSLEIPNCNNLSIFINSKTDYLVKNNLWPDYLKLPPSYSGEQQSESNSTSSEINSSDLYSILGSNKDVNYWLDTISTKEPPIIIRQPPKPHSTTTLLSANNSVSSLPLNKRLFPQYSNHNRSRKPSMSLSMLVPPVTSSNSTSRSNSSTITGIASPSNYSHMYVDSINSVRSVRKINLKDLKASVDLEIPKNTTKDNSVLSANGSLKKSGLAYCITNLDLSDEDD